MMRNLLSALLLLFVFQTGAFAQARQATAPAEPLPLEVFARLPETEGPQINTDGTALAMKVRANGEQVLAVVPLDQPNVPPMVIARDGEFDRTDDYRTVSWRWIDEDNLLIWLVSRQNVYGQPADLRRLVAFNRDTKQLTRLGWNDALGDSGSVIWTSRSGPPKVLISRLAWRQDTERLGNPEVIEVEVETGRQRLVERPRRGVASWYADGEGNVRLGTSFDATNGRLQALYRAGGSGNFRTIIRERLERYAEPPVPQIFLSGERAIAVSRHEGYSAAYEIDLQTMEFGRKLFGADGYDIAGIGSNPEDNALERVSVIRDRPEHHWFDQRMRDLQQVIDESWGAGNATIVSTDRLRQNIVVRVAKPNQAGAFYLFNTETGSVRFIGWVNGDLKDMELNPVRTIRYRASDGASISAVLTLPRLRDHRNLPLIVLPHGGPWARDHESWDIWAQPLAELGYAVVQPNFRGSSGFGLDWEAASDGNWGLRMQDDLNDAVTHLAAEGIADPRRVCMFGWSYGGYAASRAAQRDGDKYRCAISGAGVHDLPDMVAYDREYLGRYGSQYIGSAAARLADVSPSRFAEQFSAPILIVHGARDDRVPVAQSRDLVRRLRDAGKVEGRDFVYVEQPRNTHHLPLEEDRLQLLEETRKFLARHNPAD